MKLVEQHIIVKNHGNWLECDRICFASKNLYNQALYRIRQHYFETGKYLNYFELQRQLQNENQADYRALPSKVAQMILKGLDKNWVSFFAAIKAYKETPSKFLGKPKIPSYKDKAHGRNVITFNIQSISSKALKQGIVSLSGTSIAVKTTKKDIQQVRIIPCATHYAIEIVYKEAPKAKVQSDKCAAIDIGLNNLATVVFSFKERPIILNGKPLKSINQYYNKKKARLQSYVGTTKSKRIARLNFKRNNKVKDYLHKASRKLVNHLVSLNVSKVIIGKNDNWKQEINLGKKNNETFCKIPHAQFIEMLQYKLILQGITVIVREESYTSKCSFFDNEEIKKQDVYAGKRVKRSWFKTATGRYIHADVNGAFNIGKKQLPKAFQPEVIEAFVVTPLRITPYQARA